MPNQKKKPSKETLEILKLYDKRLEDKEIAKRLGLRPASVRARKAHRTMETYDLKAIGPKVDSSGLALTKKQPPRYRERTDEQVIEELFSDDISAKTTKEKSRQKGS